MMWTSSSSPDKSSGGGDGGGLLPVTPERGGEASNNKDQQQQQQQQQHDNEIEALRQRGLAKLLNKHFTETTKKLAAEKAAADAALRDLEARKIASINNNNITGGGEGSSNSPGAAGALENNGDNVCPLDSLYASVQQWRNECRRKERETLLLYQRYVHKFGASGQIKLPPSSSPGGEAAAADATTSSMLPAAPLSPDAASARPGVPPPSESPRRNDSPPSVLVPTSRVPQSHQQQKQQKQQQLFDSLATAPSAGEKEFRNYYRRQLEQRNQHHIKGGGAKKICEDEPIDVTQPNAYFDPFVPTILGRAGGGNHGHDGDDDHDDDDNEDDDDDDISMISGLTSVNSAMTRQILNDCEQTVVTFLQEEKKAIKQLMDRETTMTTTLMTGEDGCSQSHKTTPSALGSIQSHAAQEAENMAKKMQEILSDFTKKEQRDKSLASTKEGRPYETSNPDESWAVYYDESYQREYYHEANTNKTQWEPPDQDGTSSSSTSTGGGGGEGDAGGGSSRGGADNANSSNKNNSSPVLQSIDVMPEVQERVSRIAVYRRKRRRLRKRRLLLSMVAVVLMAAFGLYHLCSNNPEMVQGWMRRLQKISQRTLGTVDSVLDTDLAGTKTKEQQLKEEQEKKAREAKIAAEAEAAARAAQAAKAAQEAKAKEDEEARLREAQKKREAEERRAKAEAERIAAAEKAAAEAEERKKALHRPWGCNIPLAYIFNGRCRRLARENPIFDPFSVVSSMN